MRKLMKVLQDKGYQIARRTVAKYREQLGIPVARLEKGALMRALALLISYILHPLWTPLLVLGPVVVGGSVAAASAGRHALCGSVFFINASRPPFRSTCCTAGGPR